MKGLAAAALVAALALPTAAIGRQLLDGADIRNDSLTGKDIKNKSLTTLDFRGSVRGHQGPPGREGPQGPPGPQGIAGKSAASMLLGTTDAGMPPGLPASTFALFRPTGFTANSDVTLFPSVRNLQITPNVTTILRDLVVKIEINPGFGERRDFTLMRADGAPLLGCSISETAFSCDSGAATATLPPQTEFLMKTSTDGSPAVGNGATWSFRALTP